MKTPKLLKKSRKLLSPGYLKKKKQARDLKEILEKLKKKSKHLKESLSQEKNSAASKKIEKDLNLVNAQRKKGLKALKDLKNS